MKLRLSLSTWCFGFVILMLSIHGARTTADAADAKAVSRPNILVILADDMGYADIGVHGCKDIPTPNIDSLAKNGVRCSSGYVSGPYCSPTRAGLMTGRYQERFGHEFNPGPPTAENIEIGLSLKETTIADRLRAAGYATGLVGKWHLGHADKFMPQSRGFDEYFGFLGGSHQYLPAARGPAANDGNAIRRGREPIHETEYLTDAFAREAVSFVSRNGTGNKPFFLYLAFNAVHGPLQATEKYLQRFANIEDTKRRTYAAMQSAMDDAIGQVLAKLRELKQEENTLIFFLSDNGGPTRVNASLNTPLRGDKGTTWEGGVRVPFLVQWKSKLPAARVFDQPLIQLDILPTSLAAAGVEISPAWKLDGVNLLPYLSGQKNGAPHDALYWRFGPQMAIRKGDWKLVKATGATDETLRRRDGKPDLSDALLFDLSNDIGEQSSVAGSNTDKVKELSSAWQSWNSELMDPQWKVAAANAAKKANKKKNP